MSTAKKLNKEELNYLVKKILLEIAFSSDEPIVADKKQEDIVITEEQMKLLMYAIKEAIQSEVFKSPEKTKHYVNQLRGNLETGDTGFKNLMMARKSAVDDEERDAIQDLIDRHPKTRKSMYKA